MESTQNHKNKKLEILEKLKIDDTIFIYKIKKK